MSGYVFISLDPISTGGEICAPVGPKGRADFGSLFGLGVSKRSRPRTAVGKGDCETADHGMELHKTEAPEVSGLCRRVTTAAAGDKPGVMSALTLPVLFPQLAHGLKGGTWVVVVALGGA